jgi:hypothetical protein
MAATPRTDALVTAIYNNGAEAAAFGTPEIAPEDAYAQAIVLAREIETDLAAAQAETAEEQAQSAAYLATVKGVVVDHNRIETENLALSAALDAERMVSAGKQATIDVLNAELLTLAIDRDRIAQEKDALALDRERYKSYAELANARERNR